MAGDSHIVQQGPQEPRIDNAVDGRVAMADLRKGQPMGAKRASIIALALALGFAGIGLAVWRLSPLVGPAAEYRLPTGGPVNGRIAFTAELPAPPSEEFVMCSDEPGPPDQIYTARGDGTDLRQLTDGKTIKGSLAWSPDGTRLAFAAYDLEREAEQLLVMSSDGKDGGLVCEGCTATFWVPKEGETITFEGCYNGPGPYANRLTWSPDGATLAAPAHAVQGVALIDVASGKIRTVETPGSVQGTSWSPDGSKLALSVRGARAGGGLFVLELETGKVMALLEAEPYAGSPPAWSPDGSLIAFARAVRDGALRAEVDIVEEAAGRSQTILGSDDLFEVYDLAWSPDGTRLAVMHHPVDPPTAGILTIAADGSDVRLVALCESGRDKDGICSSNEGGFDWAPDGRALVFDNYDGEGRALSVVGLDGSVTPLSGDLVPGCCVAWQSVATD